MVGHYPQGRMANHGPACSSVAWVCTARGASWQGWSLPSREEPGSMSKSAERRLDWMISVDDHVLEPPAVWQDRVPAKYRGAAPQIVHRDGLEYWQYEGKLFPTSGLAAVAG